MLYLSMDTGHIKTLEDAIGIINKLFTMSEFSKVPPREIRYAE